jgi:hypothetical protein
VHTLRVSTLRHFHSSQEQNKPYNTNLEAGLLPSVPSYDDLLHFHSANFLVRKILPVKSKNVTWLITFIHFYCGYYYYYYYCTLLNDISGHDDPNTRKPLFSGQHFIKTKRDRKLKLL